MAVFGTLETVRAQLAHTGQFNAAFAYLDEVLRPGTAGHARVHGLSVGTKSRIELSGGAFVFEETYLTKVRAQGFFESHREFIDVQVIISGEELMEVADTREMTVSEDLTPGKDMIKYLTFDVASVLRLRPGHAAVFFPIDGHMPTLAPREPAIVRKVVVKVPVLR